MPSSKNPSVRRGDLDNMRLRKDELRKRLDDSFAVLQRRIGRFRSEPLGFDRDFREYYLLGGLLLADMPAEPGKLEPSCLSDQARLLVRIRKPAGKTARGRPLEDMEEWRLVGSAEELQALIESLRPAGEREHKLARALLETAPHIKEAMTAAEQAQAAIREAAEAAEAEALVEAASTGASRAASKVEDGATGAQGGADDEAEGEEDEDEDEDEDEELDENGDPTARRWTYAGRQSYAARALRVSWGKDRREAHRRMCLGAIGRSEDEIEAEIERGVPVRPATLIERLQLEMLDLFAALPAPPPEDARVGTAADDVPHSSVRPGADECRRRWTDRLSTCEDAGSLGELLLQYAKALPKTAFRKGFRRWWLADGGLEDTKVKLEKELRKLDAGGADKKSKGAAAAAAEKERADKEKADKEKESKENPPAQSDSAHQVLLRLQLLDAGLAFC